MANFLKAIAESGSNLFSKKEASVIGIDIGSSFLKVIQLREKKGKAILETYGELALGPYAGLAVGQATNLPVEKISEAINDLFKEANITSTNSGLSLPLRSSLLSVMEMPEIPEKQLAKMIPIEARKYIPVPVSEVTLDWWVVPEEQSSLSAERSLAPEEPPATGEETQEQKDAREAKKAMASVKKIEVLVVAIHNETITKYNDIINKVGLSNSFLELEVFSTARSSFGNHTAPVMVLDFGGGSTKLSVVEYGIIKTQHIVNRGSQDLTRALSQATGISLEKAEEVKRDVGLLGTGDQKESAQVLETTLSDILVEANRVLLNYQRKYNRTIKNVVLAGGGALLKGFYELAEKHLETDVIFADSFSKIEAPAFLQPVLKDAGPEFSVAIGLALRKLQESA